MNIVLKLHKKTNKRRYIATNTGSPGEVGIQEFREVTPGDIPPPPELTPREKPSWVNPRPVEWWSVATALKRKFEEEKLALTRTPDLIQPTR